MAERANDKQQKHATDSDDVPFSEIRLLRHRAAASSLALLPRVSHDPAGVSTRTDVRVDASLGWH